MAKLNANEAAFKLLTGQELTDEESTALRDALDLGESSVIRASRFVLQGKPDMGLRLVSASSNGYIALCGADSTPFVLMGNDRAEFFGRITLGTYPGGAKDTGLSRISAKTIGAGNGDAGDDSGELRAADVVVKSPDGTRWRLSVDNSGTLTPTAI